MIITWGIIVASFGLGILNPVDSAVDVLFKNDHILEGILLIVGGLITSAIGIGGVWECLIPRLRKM